MASTPVLFSRIETVCASVTTAMPPGTVFYDEDMGYTWARGAFRVSLRLIADRVELSLWHTSNPSSSIQRLTFNDDDDEIETLAPKFILASIEGP